MRTRLHVGFDIVFEIDPAVYVETSTGDGVGYRFTLDDTTREQVAECVSATLDYPADVASVTVAPGYLRVQVEPPAAANDATDGRSSPKELLNQIAQVPAAYNERYAQDADFDGLAFADCFFTTYRPDGDTEHVPKGVDIDAGPSGTAPEFEFERDVPNAGAPRFVYEYTIGFDAAEMYTTSSGGEFFGGERPGFKWSDTARDRFTQCIEDETMWPVGRHDAISHVAAYPGCVTVTHHTSNEYDVADHAKAVRRALAQYNKALPEHPEIEGVHLPPVELRETVHVATRDAPTSADEWIADRALDEEDGSAREPETADVDTSDATTDGDGWHLPNPFNGGN